MPTSQAFSQNSTTICAILLLVFFYLAYYWKYQCVEVQVRSQYNTKFKNIGNPLPAFPNGWYVACSSADIKKGQTKSVDISGQNLVVFRSNEKGSVYALQAYCKHMGANLGIQGKVINQKCIQCPFHGWLYDGETGSCVDYDGKPIKAKSVEYNDQLGKKNGKLNWIQNESQQVELRKFPVYEANGFIYVWIHAVEEEQRKPHYPVINVEKLMKEKGLNYRGRTVHHIKSHMMDVPENGADIYHFKYVHQNLLPFTNALEMIWQPVWCRGDDSRAQQLIWSHKDSGIHAWKQKIYNQYIKPFPDLRYISLATVDTSLKILFFPKFSALNITIVQLGPSLVYIFVKFKTHYVIFIHYHQPQQIGSTNVIHAGFCSWYLPYLVSAFTIVAEGNQVTNDMYIWSAKKFGRKLYYKENESADSYLKDWRKWFSQYFEGTQEKEAKIKERMSMYSW